MHCFIQRGFLDDSAGKESTYNSGDWRDAALILGLGRPLEEVKAIHYRILAWETPWTEEPGRLQFLGRKELDITEHVAHFI